MLYRATFVEKVVDGDQTLFRVKYLDADESIQDVEENDICHDVRLAIYDKVKAQHQGKDQWKHCGQKCNLT